LVVGGSIIQKELSKNNAKLFPVDSEHSAIWQCLIGENKNEINFLHNLHIGHSDYGRPNNADHRNNYRCRNG